MVFDKIVNIVGDQLGIKDIENLTNETSLEEDLGIDETDRSEINMIVGDVFDMEISNEIGINFKTIGDIVKYIDTNAKK